MIEKKDNNVFGRLKAERERLGLNQAEVATFCDVSDKTIRRWEMGTPIPADKLSVLVSRDFNALYILTGKKAEMNFELLEFAIECAELYITEADKQLTPHKKAKLIRILYKAICEDEKNQAPEASSIISLIEMAS